MVFEKTLESPLDCKEIKPVHSRGNQSWVFFGRTDAEAETPILWSPYMKNWLTGKDPDAVEDWRQGGERRDRGWDGWTASLTRWTWVWASSGKWWRPGKPGVLKSTGSQSVGQDRVTEQRGHLRWKCQQAQVVRLSLQNVSTRWRQHVPPPASGSSDNQSLRESGLPGLWVGVSVPEQNACSLVSHCCFPLKLHTPDPQTNPNWGHSTQLRHLGARRLHSEEAFNLNRKKAWAENPSTRRCAG